MKKITFICNKLARDKTIETMPREGIQTHHHFLTKSAFLKELNNKLMEEALEVTQATSRSEVIAELADVLEVIDALKQAYNLSDSEILTTKERVRQARGGFRKGVYLQSITMDDTNPRAKHFRASPDRYREQ